PPALRILDVRLTQRDVATVTLGSRATRDSASRARNQDRVGRDVDAPAGAGNERARIDLAAIRHEQLIGRDGDVAAAMAVAAEEGESGGPDGSFVHAAPRRGQRPHTGGARAQAGRRYVALVAIHRATCDLDRLAPRDRHVARVEAGPIVDEKERNARAINECTVQDPDAISGEFDGPGFASS